MKGKAATGDRETEARQSASVERHLCLMIRMRNHVQKENGNVGASHGSSHALHAEDVPVQGNLWRIRQPKLSVCMFR